MKTRIFFFMVMIALLKALPEYCTRDTVTRAEWQTCQAQSGEVVSAPPVFILQPWQK